MDIRATVRILIREHGDKAAIVAAQEADAALKRGDMEAAYQWRRVVNTVHELTASQTERMQ